MQVRYPVIQWKRLTDVDKEAVMKLMNHPALTRHMPLLSQPFTDDDYERFIEAKEQLWATHGYGPWAFIIDGQFAGWGGLQPEDGEPDLAMVLHPDFWGHGKIIYDKIVDEAFGPMGFKAITALLPQSRASERVLQRLGFCFDGQVSLAGREFRRYRLTAEARKSAILNTPFPPTKPKKASQNGPIGQK